MHATEFHYRMPRRVGGVRPGAHPGLSLGAGDQFVSHARLFQRPDPRRLDLRASLRRVGGLDDDWLVRVHRQRAGIAVHLLVDVSASMRFGAPHSKLVRIAEFAASLGRSAHRLGDALGLLAFDARARSDLWLPAQRSRGMGELIAQTLRASEGGSGSVQGLAEASERLAGRSCLVFLASDFHWPLDGLAAVLDLLGHAFVVPMIVWDAAEIEPPDQNGVVLARDTESGAQRTLWMRPALRQRWRDSVARRRAELDRIFTSHALRSFPLEGRFDAEAMSRYFLEACA